LRRLLADPDPLVSGSAVRALHDLWVPIDRGELPEQFNGYHDGRRINRGDPELESVLLRSLRGEVGDGPEYGYSAYEIGVLGLRSAIPALAGLRRSGNPFVREAAARALFDLREVEAARESYDQLAKAFLDEYERALDAGGGRVPPQSRLGELDDSSSYPARSPWYAILACRGMVECGGPSRELGLARLLRLYECLELSDDVNDRARLVPLRKIWRVLTGTYAHTALEARESLELPR
jgi:HEAT repeat protein